MPKVLYNMVVVTGTYTDATGATKKKYQTIGVVLEGNGGSQFALMDRTFNPAGVPHDPAKGNSIMVSFYPPESNSGLAGREYAGPKPGSKPLDSPPPGATDEIFNEIPF